MASEVLFNKRTCQFRSSQSKSTTTTIQHTKHNLPWTAQLFNETIIRKCPKVQQSSKYQYSMEYENKKYKFQKHRWKSNGTTRSTTSSAKSSATKKIKTNKINKKTILCKNIKNDFSKNITNNTFRKILVESFNEKFNYNYNGKWKTNFRKISNNYIFTQHQSNDNNVDNVQQDRQSHQQQHPCEKIEKKFSKCFQNEKANAIDHSDRQMVANGFDTQQTNDQMFKYSNKTCCQLYSFNGTASNSNVDKFYCCQEINKHSTFNANQHTFICQHRKTHATTSTAAATTTETTSTTDSNNITTPTTTKKCDNHNKASSINKRILSEIIAWRKLSSRRYRWDLFGDLQKIIRIFLPILLVVNMFSYTQAVASDLDASIVSSSFADNTHSRISVVEYLEPLSRPTKPPKCDQTIVSRSGSATNGTFSAPLLHNPTNHTRQCLYIFLASPGQRVEIIFTSFNLRGTPPGGAAVGELPACIHEYMDIYAEVQSSDPAELINSPFGGRYCGPIPPRRRISLYRVVALSFFTAKNETTPDLFEGRYAFINDSEYDIGAPVVGSLCSYTINFAQNRSGVLISPTYPGAYPKDMSCTYQFIGKPSQRVRIEFRDFDLFFGGPHCPFDYVRVHDGPDNSSAIIGTYCGQQRNLVLYSSESSLFVHFSTLQRTANTQNRGFKGIFEFSESFVKLDFIRENDGVHIRGSECDQKILSKKESTGFVYSPNYPFPYIPKVVCRYFVYGMQDAQNLERVKLEFSIFEIPKGENKNSSESNCTDGYLKIYLKGQETTDSYDKFDHELCGNEIPHMVVSDGPRLVMVFSSGELQGRGFKAKYSFETEYKIPGTAAPDGTCSFTYRSTSKKKGEFNSPLYPSNYPSEKNCSYVFLGTPNEQVTIVFDHFKVKADGVNTTGGAYGVTQCFEDWLEMFILFRDGTDRFLGRYCGFTAPGPVESPRGAVGVRILLHTDLEKVASGFKARYIFEVAKSVFGDCGGNYSGQDSGIIVSPNYPANYEGPGKGLASRACNWYLTARAGYKILLHFDFFAVEGDPAGRGCPAAVLRLWLAPDTDMAPLEMCGEKGNEPWQHLTLGNTARVSFTSADKTIGAQGFRVIWTEVQDAGPGPPSSISLLCESTYHFQCQHSGYCISERVRCDGVKNCGPDDNSDEMHCTAEAPVDDHGALIISSIAAGSFLTCLLCTLCHRKRKRRHHRQLGLHRNAAHYESTTSATGLGSSRRHLQSGGSLSGSMHALSHDESFPIPPAPLPPTSVPPHIFNRMMNDDDDDEEEDEEELDLNGDPFNIAERFASGDSV